MATTKEAMATTKESGSVPVFDTRGYVRTLVRGGGVAEKQADAHADALQGVLSGVSTKADIDGVRVELRAEMKVLRAEMRLLTKRIEMLEQSMDVRFQAMQNQLDGMQDQMQAMRQMIFLGFSLMGTLVVIATLLLGFG